MKIELGNAYEASTIDPAGEKTGWFIGSKRFIKRPGLSQCEGMELKWSVHPKDFVSSIKPCHPQLGVSVLIQGRLMIAFRASPEEPWQEYRLTRPGDYVISKGGAEHYYRADDETTVLTVRLTENDCSTSAT